jgi:hypothetical protein
MHRPKLILIARVAFGILCGLTTAIASGEKVQSFVSRYSNIFVVEVEEATASAWQQGNPQVRTIAIGGRVTQVLRKSPKAQLAPGSFAVTITQAQWATGRIGDNPSVWSDKEIKAGNQFLIFSTEEEGSAAELLRSPERVDLASGSTIVDDVTLIARLDAAPVAEQASAAATAWQKSPQPRSIFLGQYVAAVLAAGTDEETAPLASAMAGGELPFDAAGRQSLLWYLFQAARTSDNPSANLLQTFGRLTAQVFSSDGVDPSGKLSPYGVNMLENQIAWLTSSEEARTVLSKAVTPAQTQRLADAVQRAGKNPATGSDRTKQLELFLQTIRPARP